MMTGFRDMSFAGPAAVGAGGIGRVLFDSIGGFYRPRASAMRIIVLAAVLGLDFLTQQICEPFQ